jgi:UDPglucose 6-dehydrogenase
MSERIAVIGSGYVGSVVAACLAHVGHDVVGVESDPTKLAQLRAGAAPFHEAGLDQLITNGLAGGNLRFTDDFRHAMDTTDVVFVCVGTPPGPDGRRPSSLSNEDGARPAATPWPETAPMPSVPWRAT